jgi:hypothetical protein
VKKGNEGRKLDLSRLTSFGIETMKKTTKGAYLVGAIAVIGIFVVVILPDLERTRLRRAEMRRLIEDYKGALAAIRRIQREHPTDAYEHLSGAAYGWMSSATIDLATRSEQFGSVDAVPMLSKVAHGSARDGTLERVVRLHALCALVMIQPEEASDLAPWVGQVLRQSAEEIRRVTDREPLENRVAAFRGQDVVAHSAMDALFVMGSRGAPAAPVLEELIAGPPVLSYPPEEYDLRNDARRLLARLRKAGVTSIESDDQRARAVIRRQLWPIHR